ncbi:amidohydrolase [Chitinophaga horti]|uniref:Amidohydrolase n=1 Tax=Chitinophaga horti TaxID=2920382 RepID=A0ABY6J1E7_9BACT|nr:amidohydrolase [Chitinophaga horti]UYQ92452.1 amidohydrolase [Chitinophaga horti]
MKYRSVILLLSLLAACKSKPPADLLLYNAVIYTVNDSFTVAQAMAIRNGHILAVGSNDALQDQYAYAERIDADGKVIYPGFIDAHAHFTGYGLGLQQVALAGTGSWQEVVNKVKAFAAANPQPWILGRGWDQNDWDVKSFPDKSQLDSAFPNTPVFLARVDGHAAVVNQAALDAAGVKAGQILTGGMVETSNGRLTGILIDNAVDLVSSKIPSPSPAQYEKSWRAAEQQCFAVGLTSVSDCGLELKEALLLDTLQRSGSVQMRVYVMLSDNETNWQWLKQHGPYKKDRINIGGMKFYADGALGSRGACLLHEYADKAGWKGFLLKDKSYFAAKAQEMAGTALQMCTHAIGDSATREILNIYASALKGKNDKRWRIEHAQVVDSADFHLFGEYSVVPSVQPTHATSDMYWAASRLGHQRVKTAYAYRQLLEQNGWLPLGTDFPVEDISPLKTFLAAVGRVDAKGYPEGGFQAENALSRERALRGMTIWAARAAFEEKEKGSLEPGKLADFILLDRDLMKMPVTDILTTRVVATYIGGRKVYAGK